MKKHRLEKDYLKDYLENHRVITPADCWEFTGYKNKRGYGVVTINTRQYLVHRLAAWVWKDCSLYTWKEQAHKCDNPACFNPEHTFEATHKENIKDANDKGRWHHWGNHKE